MKAVPVTAADVQRDLAPPADRRTAGRVHVALFIDWSNITWGARYAAARQEGAYAERAVRVDVESLFDLGVSARTPVLACAAGGPGIAAVRSRLEARNVEVLESELGKGSGREQNVDAALQAPLLRAGYDLDPAGTVVVVATGDGAGSLHDRGFLADLRRAADRGFAVEVLAWRKTANRYLRRWAEETGAFIELDPYYRQVTFLAGGLRRREPLTLRRRPTCAVRAT